MKVSEFVREAQKHVEKGWCQGVLEDKLGNVCAIGALSRQRYVVYGGRPKENLEAYRAAVNLKRRAEEALACIFDEHYGLPIIEANDELDTTQADIIAMFEKTAISLEELGQ